MLTANDTNGNKIWANEGTRYSECYCPWCGERLTHKIGKIRTPHFAHRSDSNCPFDKDSKGQWHVHMQELFPKESQEYRFYDETTGALKHIADVFLERSNTVIEFQHSPISEEDFKSRTDFHTSAGRRIVWVFDVMKKNPQNSYLRYSHLYKDMQHHVFIWKQVHSAILSSCFGAKGPDQYKNVSICLYTGNEGDIVHRIISHDEGYKLIMLSVNNYNLEEKSADDFFYDELRWANPEEWVRRKQLEDEINKSKERPLIRPTRGPQRSFHL